MTDSLSQPATAAGVTQSDPSMLAARRFLRVAAVLGFLGCALFATASWLPWFAITGRSAYELPGSMYTSLPLDPAQIGAPPLNRVFGMREGVFIWSLLTVLGLLLYPLVWRRGGRRFGWWALGAYILWILCASALTYHLIVASTHFATGGRSITVISFNQYAVADFNRQDSFLAVFSHLQYGNFLAVAGLVLAWIAPLLPLMVAGRDGWQAWREYLTDEPRRIAGEFPPGSGWLASSLGLWLAATLVVQWLAPTFVQQDRAPVSLLFSRVVGVALHTYVPTFDPLFALHAMNLLLDVGAVMIAAGLCLPGTSRAYCGWVTAWLVVASTSFVLGIIGVSTFGRSWSGGGGAVFLGGLALAFGWLGVALFWARVLRPRPA